MCGIVGYITPENLSSNTIIKMNEKLVHRGPDDEGYYYSKTTIGLNLAFGHKRLSIIDLSELGQQPMKDISDSVVVVFNGEIYNFLELRNELTKLGYLFKSKTDTEVIINSYIEWGLDCFKKFNGMFAIAIYDKRTERILLIRDRLGVKPLYYFLKEETLVFASELKAIIEYPNFIKKINQDSIYEFLFNQYISAPNTIFQNVYKLEPGTIFTYVNGKTSIDSYWDIDEIIETKKSKSSNKISELKNLLVSSIKLRMISDVPLGVYLSGGIDSSLIAILAQEVSNVPINTFTIKFKDAIYDESDYSKEIANMIGSNHYEIELDIEDGRKLINESVLFYDEPFADESMIATLLLSKETKKYVTVVLTGDGADELFWGYYRYSAASDLKKYKYISKLLKILKFRKNDNMSPSLFKLFNIFEDNRILNINYLYYLEKFKYITKQPLLPRSKFFEINSSLKNIKEKSSYLDLKTYLPDDILVKIDRSGMAFSIEARNPFLDYRIVEFALKLSNKYKMKRGKGKLILKRILSNYVSSDFIKRKKHGFSVPVIKWIKNDQKHYVERFFNKEFIDNQGIFNYDGIEKVIEEANNKDSDSEQLFWNLIIFQTWYKRYMLGDINDEKC